MRLRAGSRAAVQLSWSPTLAGRGRPGGSVAGIDASMSSLPRCDPREHGAAIRGSPRRRTTMHRRQFIGTTLAASVALFGCGTAATEEAARPHSVPRSRPCRSATAVKVAFMLGDGANVIDTAGPWEVFQDVMTSGALPQRARSSSTPLRRRRACCAMTGGLEVQPALHASQNAPQPQRHRRARPPSPPRNRANG